MTTTETIRRNQGIRHIHGEAYHLHAKLDDTKERTKEVAEELAKQGYRYFIYFKKPYHEIYTNGANVRPYRLSELWG